MIFRDRELENRVKKLEDDVRIILLIMDNYIEKVEKESNNAKEIAPMIRDISEVLNILIKRVG